MSFITAFAETIGHEGDFSNDPADSGGATRFGITEAVARANGYEGPMQEIPFHTAKVIAKRQYWDPMRLDAIDVASNAVAVELFDTGYNMGVGRAGQFLQRALNALNREGADYPDVTVDGVIGPMTVSALRSFISLRGQDGERALLRILNCLQGAAYVDLVERRSKDEKFLFGWVSKRVSIAGEK